MEIFMFMLINMANVLSFPFRWLGERIRFFNLFNRADKRVNPILLEWKKLNDKLVTLDDENEEESLLQEVNVKIKECIKAICKFLALVVFAHVIVVSLIVLSVHAVVTVVDRIIAYANAHWGNMAMVIIISFFIVLMILAYLHQKYKNRGGSHLTEAQIKVNHSKLRKIFNEAVMPIALSLGLRLPKDYSELVPPTESLYYVQSGITYYYISLPIAHDTELEEIDNDDIIFTLNRRLVQMEEAGQLPLIASGGILDVDSGAFTCPIKVERLSVYDKNVVIEVSILGG